MPEKLYRELSADVHFHLGEAFHTLKNTAFADAHYKKALHLYREAPRPNNDRISFLKIDMSNLEGGADPELHCPSLKRIPMWLEAGDESPVPPTDMQSGAFITKIKSLLAEHKYELAESHLREGLMTHFHPFKTLDAAVALNLLGSIYLTQQDYVKAARQFRQAMRTALSCCDADNAEARKAYEGLRDMREHLSERDQKIATLMSDEYFEKLQKLSRKKAKHGSN
jgi:tetratricopeptide (TPR) repeat protein